MTDFFSELEQQVLGAARRRAGRRLPPVPRMAAPALAAAAILVVALLAVRNPSDTTEIRGPAPPSAPAVSGVTVSVRNGTTFSCVATRVAHGLRRAGDKVGFVGNAVDQQRATSVVMYEPADAKQARAVAARLGISAFEPFTDVRTKRADVVVIAGRDVVKRDRSGAVPLPWRAPGC